MKCPVAVEKSVLEIKIYNPDKIYIIGSLKTNKGFPFDKNDFGNIVIVVENTTQYYTYGKK
jgi:hypothetical protein